MSEIMTRKEALKQAWPYGVTTYALSSIEEAVKLGVGCRQYWFRGHSQVFDLLLPAVYREPFRSARTNIEFWAGQRFRFRARSFTGSVPPWGDHLSWLLMMQHHGVQTRLLDWTESVLVALYFATGDPKDRPGEIWCMNPHRLNRCSDWKICMPDDAPIRYLAAEVFLNPKLLPTLQEELELKAPPILPLAFVPAFEFQRMAAQRSRFTVHPSANPTSMVDYLLRDEKCLVRYTIQPERKAALRRDLWALGVSHDSLFQSLEHLAKTIEEEILEPNYQLRNPPNFSAE